LQNEGSEIIRNLPDTNVLLYLIIKPILLMLAMFHVFNASLSGRDDTIKNVLLMAA
jgi:hypothetical protein